MATRWLTLAALAVALLGAASSARAHEQNTFKIGDRLYRITVGSLNEPFVVDDMSGVDVRVSELAVPPGSTGTAGKSTPVTGLEDTLKVELGAGDKKRTLSLEPSEGGPGFYAARFIPTVETTYTYRLFGKINDAPVDLTFTCVPGEVSETARDGAQVKVSDTITRLEKIGAFSCPEARSAAGFPEPAFSSYELNHNTENLLAALATANQQARTARTLGLLGLIAGIGGLALAGLGWKRK